MATTPLTPRKINKIAARLFSLQVWIDGYGKRFYYTRSAPNLVKRLQNNEFYDEWKIYKFGWHYYIYLSKNKKPQNFSEGKRIKISPTDIETIKSAHFTKKGDQARLALEMGISEAYISRVRKGERRIYHQPSNNLTIKQKKNLFLSDQDVTKFFSMMLTAKEFLTRYGKTYQITSHQVLYKRCAEDLLPDNWSATNVGGSWLIYLKKPRTAR